MSHDFWTDRLSDWIDGELDSRQASAVEEHIRECPGCAELVEQLNQVRRRAGALTPDEPARDLWPGIHVEIETAPVTHVIELPLSGSSPRNPRAPARRVSVAALPLVAVLALLAGWVAGSGTIFPALPGAGAAGSGELTADGATSTGAVDPSLIRVRGEMIPPDRARLLSDLEGRVQRETASLPPETLEQLRQSLATIDRALAEALEALSRDPSNDYLRAHAGAGVDRKERLLRGLAEMLEADS